MLKKWYSGIGTISKYHYFLFRVTRTCRKIYFRFTLRARTNYIKENIFLKVIWRELNAYMTPYHRYKFPGNIYIRTRVPTFAASRSEERILSFWNMLVNLFLLKLWRKWGLVQLLTRSHFPNVRQPNLRCIIITHEMSLSERRKVLM